MIFFDTETTGLIKNNALNLNLQPHIIEIGCVKIRQSGPSGTFNFSTTIKPPIRELEPKITKITGLTINDLSDSPTFKETWEALAEFFLGEDTLVAHNMPFDHGMLEFELRRINRQYQFPWPIKLIDTIHMAKPFYGGRFMKLQALYEDLIGPYEQKHRAIDDCLMLQKVYNALLEKGK